MTKYHLKFKLFDLKLQTTVEANSEEEAKNCVRNRVKFFSILPNYRFIHVRYDAEFEFYGKKLEKIIEAKHEIQTKQIIVNSIKFVSVTKKTTKKPQDDMNLDLIKDFFGFN